MKNLNKLFNLLLFSFLISTQLYAADQYTDPESANDFCPGENLSTIVSGDLEFTGTIERKNNGQGWLGIDYSLMTIPNDGNITITWVSDDANKKASFLLGTSCNDASLYDGSEDSHIHTVSTFPVKQNDIIYIKIYDGDDQGYTINITYTIDTPSSGSDLQITKVDSDDPVQIGGEFYYIIDVSNQGSATAEGVTVIDTLPSGMEANMTKTNNSVYWTCTQSFNNNRFIVTCDDDNNIPSGVTHTIYLHTNAPLSPGSITNNVEVSDTNGSNDTAFEETNITAEIPNADNLCYIENTFDYYNTTANLDINASCKKEGNFYYGNIGGQDPCIAKVIIHDTNLSGNDITGLVFTKMYAPGLTRDGFAETNLRTVDDKDIVRNGGAKTSLNIPSYTSYKEGYIMEVGALLTDEGNFTITDTASDYNPNMNGIALYADYNISNGIYNEHHFGRIYACDGGGEGGIVITFSADAIDTPITSATIAANYNASNDTSDTGNNIKYIRTMVAKDTSRPIEGVHLNEYGEATLYNPSDLRFNFLITPYIVSDNCDGIAEEVHEAGTTQPLFLVVPPGEYSDTGNMAVSETARESARIQLIYMDPDSLSVEGQNCILSSSIDGNFAGVPSCANSEVQYSAAFGQDAWDRCGIDSGLPCVSKNHGIADVTDPSYDPTTDHIYVNDYGCYLCTFNIQPVCSTDNFAIRPDRFDMGMTDSNAPNLLRAGEGYSISLTARDALNTIPVAYTVIDHNFINDLNTSTTRYFKNGVEDTADLLHGTSELNKTTTAYMVSGLSSLNKSNTGSAQEIVDVTYDDVGKIKLEVYDQEWASIDNDDTFIDCNDSHAHTYICGELNVTFIPHHFSFAELNITNHAGPDNSDFTYVADRRGMPVVSTHPIKSPMAGRIQTRIEALNKAGNITENFRAEDALYPYHEVDETTRRYYEHPVNVSFVVTVPSTGTNNYLYPDANESSTTTITDTDLYNYIGFGRSGFDNNGTRNVLWDESNFPLDFNFRREINKPANPFDVNGSYLSIIVTSEYTDLSTPSSPQIIEGSRIGDKNTSTCISPPIGSCVKSNADNNATFYYGRTRASQYFYEHIREDSVDTPILMNVYCDTSTIPVPCTEYHIKTSDLSWQTDETHLNWYLSREHNATRGDGNITIRVESPLIEPSGTAATDQAINNITYTSTNAGNPGANIMIVANAIDNDVNVSRGSAPLPPLTVPLELIQDGDIAAPANSNQPYTNQWLIYNKDFPAPPSPFYKVRFIGEAEWTGEGDTGYVMDIDASYKKTKRLDW